MKLKKAIITALMILTLSLSLIGCSDTDTSSTEENLETEEVETEVAETEKGVEKDPLFSEIYYKIANKEIASSKNSIMEYLKANNFMLEENSELNSILVKDKNNDNSEVYIRFDELEGTEIDSLMSISYNSYEKKSEVSFSNLSPKRESQYDKLSTHILGESSENADSLEDQINFLNNK